VIIVNAGIDYIKKTPSFIELTKVSIILPGKSAV
jgi:hypothetical protein